MNRKDLREKFVKETGKDLMDWNDSDLYSLEYVEWLENQLVTTKECENCGKPATGESLDEVPLCDECGNGLENDAEKVTCPECLMVKTQDELDMFGGLCEDCSGAFD